MITPGLWRRALIGALQWRLLALWLVGLAIPAAALLEPIAQLSGGLLDHAPRSKELVASLDAEALVDVLRSMGPGERGDAPLKAAIPLMGILLLLISPLLAGMAVAAARASEPLRTRELLRGAADSYGRMLRLLLVAAIPLGLAGAATAGLMFLARQRASNVLTEASATNGLRAAVAISAALFFLAHLTIDLARGTLAAQPDRRSALLAWGHALRVLVRRPLRVLGMGLIGTLAAALLAFLFVAVRYQIVQSNAFAIALAWILTQLAVASLGWGRAARIFGLAELVRADAADRERMARPAAAATQAVPAEPLPPAPLPKMQGTA